MKFGRYILLLSIFCSQQVFSATADSLSSSLDSARIEQMASHLVGKLKEQIRKNEKNTLAGKSSENDYLVLDEDDYFKVQKVNQDQNNILWDENHEGLQQVQQSLRVFNGVHETKYYVIIASIYNYYNLDETTTINIDWNKLPSYNDVKSSKPVPKPYSYAEKNREKFHEFFKSIIASKLAALPGKNIVHVTSSFYIPLPAVGTQKKYALFHHQAVQLTGLETAQNDALSGALRMAEQKINNNKQKESWLSAAVDFAIHAFENPGSAGDPNASDVIPVVCSADSIPKKIDLFANALNGRKNPDLINLENKTEDFFILKPVALNDFANTEAYKLLDDKIAFLYQTLKSRNIPFNFYILIQDFNCQIRDPALFKDFAKKVYEKSTLNGKPAIVITVPLWITQVIEGFNAPDRFNYDIGQADIFDNTGLLANRELIFTDSKDIPYIIQSTYKQIKKPYVRFEAYLNVDGSVHYKKPESRGLVSGYNNVHDLFLWIKPEFYEFVKNPYPSISCWECVDYSDYGTTPNPTKHAIAVFKHLVRRDDILARATATPNQWLLEEPDTPLKEWCIADQYKSFALYNFEQSGFINWLESAGILIGAHSIDEECLREFDAWEIVDPAVYGVIDATSIIPGVDEFAEGVGLLYSSARGDGENATMYLVGLTIPGVGVYAVKGVVKTGKLLIKGTLYALDQTGKTIRVLAKSDELKSITRNILKFTDQAGPISEDQLVKVSRLLESCSFTQVDDIVRISGENITDSEKLAKLIKLLDNVNFNLTQIRKGVEELLGNRIATRQLDGNTFEILVKENNEKLIITCAGENGSLEYAVKGAGGYVDVATQPGWNKLGNDILPEASIKMPDGSLKKDAIAVVEKVDGQGKKVIRIGNCFPAGHLVYKDYHETIKIEDVRKGDVVLAKNVLTGSAEKRSVTKTYQRTTDRLVNLYHAGKLIAQPTPEHPFWVEEQKQYVKAVELKKGDQLTVLDPGFFAGLKHFARSHLEIDSVVIRDTTVAVYNFEVEGLSNYFVGNHAVLVHNANYSRVVNTDPNTVYKIKGQLPKNADQAAKSPTRTLFTGSGNPVKFDGNGFPDFTEYIYRGPDGKPFAFEIDMKGNYTTDFAQANEAAGFGKGINAHPKGWTWHHHQDGKTMMLVPSDINTPPGGIWHTGGKAVVEHNALPANAGDQLYFASPVFN
jgi:hypothetical protein